MRDELQPRDAIDVTLPAVSGGALTIAGGRPLVGCCRVPGDKSISHRYAMFGAIAEGRTSIAGLSPGADVQATLAAVAALGAVVTRDDHGIVHVDGRGSAGFEQPRAPLDVANSGTTMRLLAGLLAGYPLTVTLTGDRSLSRRPMRRVLDPLTAMGARCASEDGHPPLTVAGGQLRGIAWRSPVASAQVKSAVLLAGLRAEGRTVVEEPAATRDHTERAFPLFGLDVDARGLTVSVDGGQHATAPATTLTVPGDPSSAAVWAAAAAVVPGSTVTIEDLCLNPRRTGFLRVLERLGATVRVEPSGEACGEPRGTVTVAPGAMRPVIITPDEVPDLIDELPVLAAAAALGGGLEVSGAAELRVKESDRISALVAGFRALGADADERPDGFIVAGRQQPAGGLVDAAGDHRLVMAFAILGLMSTRPVAITGADVVAVSYPEFARQLGAFRR